MLPTNNTKARISSTFTFKVSKTDTKLQNEVAFYECLLSEKFSVVFEKDNQGNRLLNLKKSENLCFAVHGDVDNPKLCHQEYQALPIAEIKQGKLILHKRNLAALLESVDKQELTFIYSPAEKAKIDSFIQTILAPYIEPKKIQLNDNPRGQSPAVVDVQNSMFFVLRSQKNGVVSLFHRTLPYPLAVVGEDRRLTLLDGNIQLLRKRFEKEERFTLENDNPDNDLFIALLREELNFPEQLSESKGIYTLNTYNTVFEFSEKYYRYADPDYYSTMPASSVRKKALLHHLFDAALAELKKENSQEIPVLVPIRKNIDSFQNSSPSKYIFPRELPSNSPFILFLQDKFCLYDKIVYQNGVWIFNTSGTDFSIRKLATGEIHLVFNHGSIKPIAKRNPDESDFSLLQLTWQELDKYRFWARNDVVAREILLTVPKDERSKFYKRAILWQKTRQALLYYVGLRLKEAGLYRHSISRFFTSCSSSLHQKLESVDLLFRGHPLTTEQVKFLAERTWVPFLIMGGLLRDCLIDAIREVHVAHNLCNYGSESLTIKNHLLPALGYEWNPEKKSYLIPDVPMFALNKEENLQSQGQDTLLLDQSCAALVNSSIRQNETSIMFSRLDISGFSQSDSLRGKENMSVLSQYDTFDSLRKLRVVFSLEDVHYGHVEQFIEAMDETDTAQFVKEAAEDLQRKPTVQSRGYFSFLPSISFGSKSASASATVSLLRQSR